MEVFVKDIDGDIVNLKKACRICVHSISFTKFDVRVYFAKDYYSIIKQTDSGEEANVFIDEIYHGLRGLNG